MNEELIALLCDKATEQDNERNKAMARLLRMAAAALSAAPSHSERAVPDGWSVVQRTDDGVKVWPMSEAQVLAFAAPASPAAVAVRDIALQRIQDFVWSKRPLFDSIVPWYRKDMDAAIAEALALYLAAAAPSVRADAVAVPDVTDAICGAGFEALRSRGFRVNASDMSCDDLAAVFKAMYEAAAAAVAVPDTLVAKWRARAAEHEASSSREYQEYAAGITDVLNAIAAAPASPAATGWLPIETAPKDGTFFIATGFNYGKSSEPRHYCMALWEQGEWREASEWNGHSSLAYLTHWRPLPPAPSADGEG